MVHRPAAFTRGLAGVHGSGDKKAKVVEPRQLVDAATWDVLHGEGRTNLTPKGWPLSLLEHG